MFVFPGQGSQFVGMGLDLYKSFPASKHVFEEVDEALGFFLSKLIFKGPKDQLDMTENTQPALMCVSMAILKALEQECDTSSFVDNYIAGHSLGEYTALCAAKAISLQDTAKLLKTRGSAMQKCNSEGGMIALLGIDSMDTLDNLINGLRCELANDNGAGQFVISGTKEAIQSLKIRSSEFGKKAIILPVSAPFHSTFVKSAQPEIQKALENVEIKKPIYSLISNVTAKSTNNVEEIKSLLLSQIVSTVRWRESINYCNELGLSSYIEIGPKKILTNLIKKMQPKAQCYSIENIDDIISFCKTIQ